MPFPRLERDSVRDTVPFPSLERDRVRPLRNYCRFLHVASLRLQRSSKREKDCKRHVTHCAFMLSCTQQGFIEAVYDKNKWEINFETASQNLDAPFSKEKDMSPGAVTPPPKFAAGPRTCPVIFSISPFLSRRACSIETGGKGKGERT